MSQYKWDKRLFECSLAFCCRWSSFTILHITRRLCEDLREFAHYRICSELYVCLIVVSEALKSGRKLCIELRIVIQYWFSSEKSINIFRILKRPVPCSRVNSFANVLNTIFKTIAHQPTNMQYVKVEIHTQQPQSCSLAHDISRMRQSTISTTQSLCSRTRKGFILEAFRGFRASACSAPYQCSAR